MRLFKVGNVFYVIGLPSSGMQHLSGRGGLVIFEEVGTEIFDSAVYYMITAFVFSWPLDVKQVAADTVVAWSNTVRSTERKYTNDASEALSIAHCAPVVCAG